MKSFKQLRESSLSRIWRHTQEHQSGGITAFRPEFTKSENLARNKQMLAYLMNKGYSVTTVKGSYVENKGAPTERRTSETSFFVVDMKDSGNLEKDLIKLGKKYDQESVLVVPKGGKNAYLVGTTKRDNAWPDYGKKEVVGSSKFGRVAGEFLSTVRGRDFAFEWVVPPKTINGIRGMKVVAEKLERELEQLED